MDVQSHNFWIGYQRVSGAFEWLDGTPTGYEHWQPGNPKAADACAYMQNNGKWESASCGDANRYVCMGGMYVLYFLLFLES